MTLSKEHPSIRWPPFSEKDLTKFVDEPFVPSQKVIELDPTSKVSDNEDEITIPLKKLKNGQVLWRSLEVHLILLSKIARNRIVYQRLSVLLEKYGYTIGLNNLKTFSLPVTEYGRSKNDHCIIHYDHYYKREKVNISVIMSMTDLYQVGSAATGIIEFKNTGYSIENFRGCVHITV